MENLIARQAPEQAIHIICDNLSAHKTKAICDFLARHPKVRIHYTPTYSSWLNQTKSGSLKSKRDLIARGISTSVKDLDQKIMRYNSLLQPKGHPLKWSYKDASNRIKPALDSSVVKGVMWRPGERPAMARQPVFRKRHIIPIKGRAEAEGGQRRSAAPPVLFAVYLGALRK